MHATGELIASSASAEVFALAGGRVLKLLRPGYSREHAEQELQQAQRAHDLGLPTPRVHQCLTQAGRFGLVFDRCEGPSWLDLLRTQACDPSALGREFFRLQCTVHALDSERLLPVQPRLVRAIQAAPGLPEAERGRAVAIAQSPPARWAACHGDFHPLNVIASERGAQIIDWTGLGRGDPGIDVTRTLLYLRFGRAGGLDAAVRAAFVLAYQADCLAAWQGQFDTLARWQAPVAMARLAYEGLEEAERQSLWRLALGLDNLWLGGGLG